MHLQAKPDAPIACDMSTARDTPEARLAEYRRLFDEALVDRERREHAVVLTFRGHAQAAVEDLARREAECCPFLDLRVDRAGDAVVWTVGDPQGRDDVDEVLDAFYALSAAA